VQRFLEEGGDINNDRVDDLGEEFTIKSVNDFCNVECSVGDTAANSLSRYGIYPVPVVGCKVYHLVSRSDRGDIITI